MNKKYFRFLADRWKVGLAFIAILYLFLVGVLYYSFDLFFDVFYLNEDIENAYFLGSIARTHSLSILLTFLMPVILFSYVHRMKSVDVYFSLPYSRRQMLVTTIASIFLVSFVLLVLGELICFIRSTANVPFSLILQDIGYMALGLLVLSAFNSLLFLLGNNMIDSLVLMTAYSLFPFVLASVGSSYLDAMTPYTSTELRDIPFQIVVYLSPLLMTYQNGQAIVSQISDAPESFHPWYLLGLLLILALSVYGLKKHYIDRRTERAEHVSDSFFAYPLVIWVYTVLALLECGILIVARDTDLRYALIVIIFALFTIARFVYQRKFSISLKSSLVFVGAAAACVGFCFLSFNSHLFGVGDRMPDTAGQRPHYEYTVSVHAEDLGEMSFLFDDTYHKNVQVSASFTIEKGSEAEKTLQPMLERVFQESVTGYYTFFSCSFSNTLTCSSEDSTEGDSSWSIPLTAAFTEDELKTLAQYTDVYVLVNPYSSEETYVSLQDYLEK